MFLPYVETDDESVDMTQQPPAAWDIDIGHVPEVLVMSSGEGYSHA